VNDNVNPGGVDIDALMDIDAETQAAIDEERANLLELTADAKGFKPKGLVAGAVKGTDKYEEGYRESWVNEEYVVVDRCVFQPNRFGGTSAVIDYTVVRGPNKDRQITQWMNFSSDDKDRLNRAKAKAEDLCSAAGVQLKLRNGTPNLKLTMEGPLVGKKLRLRYLQAWRHPWDQQAGRPVTTEPKKLDKVILGYKQG